MTPFFGAFFLGWGLGANDAANSFGTAVSTGMVSWRRAAMLMSLFVILGAYLQGDAGIATLSGLTIQDRTTATVTVFAAAGTVILMTLLRLPISTSQAVVGAIVGVGIMHGHLNLGGLGKVAACWIGTPVGGAVFYVIFHVAFKGVNRVLKPSVFVLDPIARGGLILFGCYGAYALGANNVANVSAVLVDSGVMGPRPAAILGGLSIAAGICTLSKRVMLTVGQRIVAEMNMFAAVIVVLAHAATVHLYALIGVPVSASQAVVGALLGISLLKGLQVVRLRTLSHVALAWVATPVTAALVAAVLYVLAHLR